MIHKQEEWYLNEPEELLAYVYWLKSQLPPKEREETIKRIAEQLDKENACPTILRGKWGLIL